MNRFAIKNREMKNERKYHFCYCLKEWKNYDDDATMANNFIQSTVLSTIIEIFIAWTEVSWLRRGGAEWAHVSSFPRK